MATTKPEKLFLELPVSFSNVNIGDDTARVGVKIAKEDLSVAQADRNMCGKRLTGKLVLRANGAQAGQKPLPNMKDIDHVIDGTFDVKGFSVSRKAISAGLTFALANIDVRELAQFAKRDGVLIAHGVEPIPDEEGNGDGEDDD